MIRAIPKPLTHEFNRAFLDYLRACGCWSCQQTRQRQRYRTEAAHIESCRYGDVENAIPLCGIEHHREGRFSLHQMGREGFERHWNVKLVELGKRYWQDFNGPDQAA